MAVESRFVVIRHGVEAKTFMDKKSADEYDKMLDMADNLADVFAQSPIDLSESAAEELSIYLAQHREEVLVALLAKKATKPAVKKLPAAKVISDKSDEPSKVVDVQAKAVKAKTTQDKVVKASQAKVTQAKVTQAKVIQSKATKSKTNKAKISQSKLATEKEDVSAAS